MRSIACWVVSLLCLGWCESTLAQRGNWPAAPRLSEVTLERHGLRLLRGEHIDLVTDLPPSPAVDTLPRVIDAAVPLLAERFGLPRSAWQGWRVQGSLMGSDRAFIDSSLLPAELAAFPHGQSRGYQLWIRDQPSDYYRRHLLLHELTHSFMATQLGGCGPGWYMEGMAELLGTHRWDAEQGELLLGVVPASRDESQMWGRTKLLREAIAARQALPVAGVLAIDNRVPLEVDSYAWCWGLAALLDGTPQFRDRFRELAQHATDPKFPERFREAYHEDWSDLDTMWRLFVSQSDYGYAFEREAIEFQSGAELAAGTGRTTLAVDRGWQSTGWLLQAGERYELRSRGRYVIGHEADGTPWPCEPGGVTLAYHNGRPVGCVIAAIDDRMPGSPAKGGTSSLLRVTTIGRAATFAPAVTGTLYLRVNDAPASLVENEGEASVAIRRL